MSSEKMHCVTRKVALLGISYHHRDSIRIVGEAIQIIFESNLRCKKLIIAKFSIHDTLRSCPILVSSQKRAS